MLAAGFHRIDFLFDLFHSLGLVFLFGDGDEGFAEELRGRGWWGGGLRDGAQAREIGGRSVRREVRLKVQREIEYLLDC